MSIELYETIQRMPKDGWIHGCLFCSCLTSRLLSFQVSDTKYDAYVCMQCRKVSDFQKEFPRKCVEAINNLFSAPYNTPTASASTYSPRSAPTPAGTPPSPLPPKAPRSPAPILATLPTRRRLLTPLLPFSPRFTYSSSSSS